MKVLKFGALWCKECLVMKPMWDAIEKNISGLETQYFDADENEEKLKEYSVTDIPTFIFLDKNGDEIERLKGVQNKEDLEEKVKKYLDK